MEPRMIRSIAEQIHSVNMCEHDQPTKRDEMHPTKQDLVPFGVAIVINIVLFLNCLHLDLSGKKALYPTSHPKQYQTTSNKFEVEPDHPRKPTRKPTPGASKWAVYVSHFLTEPRCRSSAVRRLLLSYAATSAAEELGAATPWPELPSGPTRKGFCFLNAADIFWNGWSINLELFVAWRNEVLEKSRENEYSIM